MIQLIIFISLDFDFVKSHEKSMWDSNILLLEFESMKSHVKSMCNSDCIILFRNSIDEVSWKINVGFKFVFKILHKISFYD